MQAGHELPLVCIPGSCQGAFLSEAWVGASSLLNRLFQSLDRGDYDRLIDCFADQGEWSRQGKTLKGKVEIREALTSRSPSLRTIHLVHNVLLDELAGSDAEVSFYLVVYRSDAPSPPPYPPPQPSAIGACEARLDRKGEGWKIRNLRTGPYLFVS